MPIYFRNTTRAHRVRSRKLVATLETLLASAGYRDASVSLTLLGDRAMRRLNREHRGKDRPTDVLSFPLFAPFSAPKTLASAKGTVGEIMLGDLVVSLDTAARQARDYDAPLERELERLLIHGVLHLLGHDHEVPLERRKMEREERRLARAIAMPWPYLAHAD